jgi:hypothetical protein
MKVIAFITNFGAGDRIIDHLKLTFVADRPPPPRPNIFPKLLSPRAERSAGFPALLSVPAAS